MTLKWKRLDQTIALEMGVVTDIGWGTVLLRPDRSVERRCKACGVIAVSPWNPLTGRVDERALRHADDCIMFDLIAATRRRG